MRPPARKPAPPSRNRLTPEAVHEKSRALRPQNSAPVPRPDLGPRPLSATQRALLEAKTAPVASPEPVIPVTATRQRVKAGKTVHVRDTQTSTRRVRRNNRRRRNVPRLLLGWASGFLVVECVAALLFSPRFNVTQVSVTGNKQISTEKVLALAGTLQGKNLVRLPTGHIRTALLAEPTLENVTIHRILPGSVRFEVTERQPWASVHLPDGRNITIDQKMVPFRVTKGAETGLPRLILSAHDADVAAPPLGGAANTGIPVVLGKPLTAPGLTEVSQCLSWAREEPGFEVESVEIDPLGKLCLNRSGGVQVRLGSQTDLEKKLKSLGLLLVKRPDLRQGTEVAYVNLYAYDAPALGLRPASTGSTDNAEPAGANTPSANTKQKTENPSVKPRRVKSGRTVSSTPAVAG